MKAYLVDLRINRTPGAFRGADRAAPQAAQVFAGAVAEGVELLFTSVRTAFWVARSWTERRRQRRALAELDDHLLRDIGIDRFEAAQEASKPFWQA